MRRHARKTEESEVNLTPMLDVVFIMLIFFIVTASFLKESGIDLNKPDAAQPQTKERKGNIVIQIESSGQIWVNKRPVDLRAVRANIERLHAENPEGAVVVQAEKDSKNGLLVKVIDAARLAGISNVSIAEADG